MSGIDSALSSVCAAQQGAMRTEIAVALAAKQLDAQRLQGDAAVQLLEVAAHLVKEAGKGASIDSLA